ncbi:MAG: divergent polysaccharide deacetylase family protein [Thermodesulfobacteriota bacterium]|nr:divergent polysaccharide deacetylase family protein [Thermodesulfobacteriota bacterium]
MKKRGILIWISIAIALVLASVVCISLWNIIKEKAEAENRIAIVIDDIGCDLSPVNEILSIDIPITLSILPSRPFSIEAAEKAREKEREILLHLPMEPYGYPGKNPGKGCLYITMSYEEIKMQLEEDIEAVPYISGVNNHMGSRFMEDEDRVELVLKHLKNRDLFFLDSLTTRNSKGKRIAEKIGMKYISRDVFIDNNRNFRDTHEKLLDIIGKKDRWETLVLTGHPYTSTIEAIRATVPLFRAEGIDVVTLSDLIE